MSNDLSLLPIHSVPDTDEYYTCPKCGEQHQGHALLEVYVNTFQPGQLGGREGYTWSCPSCDWVMFDKYLRVS